VVLFVVLAAAIAIGAVLVEPAASVWGLGATVAGAVAWRLRPVPITRDP
jgi:hypothetical protein